MATETYQLYTTPSSFILMNNLRHGNALVIDRRDSTKIEIVSRTSVDPSYKPRFIICCLGIFRLLGESYLVVVESAKIAANLTFGGDVNVIRKITLVDFISFSTGRGCLNQLDQQEEKPFTQVMNLLNSGHFYWCQPGSKYDITRTLQDQIMNPKSSQPIWERSDKRFYWNKYLQKDFIAYRLYDWCFPIVQGYVINDTVCPMQGKNLQYTLISRRSRFRAGTRFNTRGIDDDGNVANFVETEQICVLEGMGTLSFLQIRGSVPVFWNQSSPQLSDLKIKVSNLGKLGKISKKKITILRTTQGTTPAFQKHMTEQISRYSNIVIVNLLSNEKQGEADLVRAYEEQVGLMKLTPPQIHYNHFDLNERTKGNRMEPLDDLIKGLDSKQLHPQQPVSIGYFFMDSHGTVKSVQNAVIRTNCKDCLDRTNIVQSRISWVLFESHLRGINMMHPREQIGSYPRLAQFLKTIWADNGDALSIQYAGSGSLKSTLTREGDYGLMGMLADGKKTMTRFYVNNFKDPGRQDVLDQLLGLHKSVQSSESHDTQIRKEISQRKAEFSQKEYKNVFVGTYNVGGVPAHEFDICEWLNPGANYPVPDIYVLGFQEVVELTAGQILQTDHTLGKRWEDLVEITLKKIAPGVKYTKLQANQLVGLVMVVFVKEDIIPLFREVETQIIKVGLKGMTGNKGGIGMRFLFCDSSFTFVTAHFAAGQGNVEDRISDYLEIDSQAKFGRQSQYQVTDSDYSFWFGDFNFRIDLDDIDIKRNIDLRNYSFLYENDQLKKALERNRVFMGYNEEMISFAPTYKYDFGTNRYDTSPKQRAPAWTDRILWRANQNHEARQLYYNRCEMNKSDHRPVRTYFQLQVLKIDKEKERQLRQELYETKSIKDGANLHQTKSTPNITHRGSFGSSNAQPLINLNQSAPNPIMVHTQPTPNPIMVHSQSTPAVPTANQPPVVPQRKISRPLPMIPQPVVAPNTTTNPSQQNRNSLDSASHIPPITSGHPPTNHVNTHPSPVHDRNNLDSANPIQPIQPLNNPNIIQELKQKRNSHLGPDNRSRSPSPLTSVLAPITSHNNAINTSTTGNIIVPTGNTSGQNSANTVSPYNSSPSKYTPVYDDSFDPRAGTSSPPLTNPSTTSSFGQSHYNHDNSFQTGNNNNNSYSKDMELLNSLHISHPSNQTNSKNPFLVDLERENSPTFNSSSSSTGFNDASLLPSVPNTAYHQTATSSATLQPPLIPTSNSNNTSSFNFPSLPNNTNYNNTNYNNYSNNNYNNNNYNTNTNYNNYNNNYNHNYNNQPIQPVITSPIMNNYNYDQQSSLQPIHYSNLNPNGPLYNGNNQFMQPGNNNYYQMQQQYGNNLGSNFNLSGSSSSNNNGSNRYSMLDN